MGYTSARKASLDAMSELGGAILSITLVMMAVFIPVSFLGGTSGVFYRQFGITMAIAIAFSALNALTLRPHFAPSSSRRTTTSARSDNASRKHRARHYKS